MNCYICFLNVAPYCNRYYIIYNIYNNIHVWIKRETQESKTQPKRFVFLIQLIFYLIVKPNSWLFNHGLRQYIYIYIYW